jgi:signal transduction histidine kinase
VLGHAVRFHPMAGQPAAGSFSQPSVSLYDVSLPSGLVGAWLRRRSPLRRAAAWVLAVAGPLLLTLASLPLRSSLVLGGFLFSMMLVVIVAATLGGAGPALTAVGLGVVARELFFAPPFASSSADLQPNLVSLIGFAVAGVVVAILIGELAKLAEEQASSRRVEAALRRVATLVAAGAPTEDLFVAVCEEAGQLLHADQITMNRYESDDTATCVAGWSRSGAAVPLGARLPLGGKNLTTIVARSHHPARMDSYADASGAVAEVVSASGFGSAAGTGVVVEGRLWGVLIAATVNEQPLAPDTETRLASFTELVATAIANAENLTELKASRARVVAAADKARRQIERDLHDGAQQRLVSLTLALRTVQMAVAPRHGELDDDLARIAEGLAGVQDDLREMARGIHPAILAQGGLAPALKVLARRCAVPVQLDVRTGPRLPERVEVAAYYVVAEALTNAAKHANASVIQVDAEATDRVLRLCVRDDGTGGADPVRGSGLVGLKDRVETLGGTITVHSPAGAGTSLHAELPLADRLSGS